MRIGTKLAAAAAALCVLASPTATDTVLGHAERAFAAIRSQAGAELAALSAPKVTVVPEVGSIDAAARPSVSAKSYRFTVKDGRGRPARWNPCATIPILVNTKNAPAGAVKDLKAAVANVNKASGLRFVIAGTTSTKPSTTWGEKAWAGRPGSWAPVLIAFGRPGTGPLANDGSSGVTSPVWVTSAGREVFVSGQIVFNSAHNKLYRPGFGKGLHRGALYEHELGHLAGLEHVNDPRQVMNPTVGGAATLAAGDRAGLRKLGSGGCIAVPAPPWAG